MLYDILVCTSRWRLLITVVVLQQVVTTRQTPIKQAGMMKLVFGILLDRRSKAGEARWNDAKEKRFLGIKKGGAADQHTPPLIFYLARHQRTAQLSRTHPESRKLSTKSAFRPD